MRANPYTYIYIYIYIYIYCIFHINTQKQKKGEQRRKEMNTVESSDRRHSLRILTNYCTRRRTSSQHCSIVTVHVQELSFNIGGFYPFDCRERERRERKIVLKQN